MLSQKDNVLSIEDGAVQQIQELVSNYFESGSVTEPVKAVNFLLNQFVITDDFSGFPKEFISDLIFETTRLTDFLTAISDQEIKSKLNEKRRA